MLHAHSSYRCCTALHASIVKGMRKTTGREDSGLWRTRAGHGGQAGACMQGAMSVAGPLPFSIPYGCGCMEGRGGLGWRQEEGQMNWAE
jgi:hypothetical protein